MPIGNRAHFLLTKAQIPFFLKKKKKKKRVKKGIQVS